MESKFNDNEERLLSKDAKSDSTALISGKISQENPNWSSNSLHMFKFDSLEKRHVWAYSIGHFFNDLCAAIWFNYLLLYLKSINPIDAKDAGYYAGIVMLSGQIADGVATPIVGFFSDKTNSERFGKRMPWYIGGVTIVAVCFVFIFEGCLFCEWFSTDENTGLKIFYFIFFPSAFNIGWASVQISHMSLVPSLTSSRLRRDKLNSLRNTFTFVANFSVLAIALVLFAAIQDSITQFQVLAYIAVGLGVVCSLIFLSIIDEPKLTTDCKKLSREVEKEIERQRQIRDGFESPKEEIHMNIENMEPRVEEKDELKLSRVAYEQDNKSLLLVKRNENPLDSLVEVKADWKSWFKMPMFYQYGLAYMGARLCTNVSYSLIYFYLIYSLKVIILANGESLKQTPVQLGAFPLILYVFSVISSLLLEKFFLRFGRKNTMSFGTFCVVIASIAEIFIQDNCNWLMYIVVAFLGFGQSISLNTSIAFISEVIGLKGSSGAFVFGIYSLLDKFSSGIVLFFILKADSFESNDPEFIRWLMVAIPALACILSWVMIMFGKAKDYKKTNEKDEGDPKLRKCSLEEEYAK